MASAITDSTEKRALGQWARKLALPPMIFLEGDGCGRLYVRRAHMTQSGRRLQRSRSAALAHATKPAIVVVMDASGSGGTTVAALLSAALGYQFPEGGDLRPLENVEKMHGGTPLTDADGIPWLRKIAEEIDRWPARGDSGVVTCSALKRSYRAIIIGDRPGVMLVFLKGLHDLIRRRLASRHEHFMPVALLDSQFAALQEPTPDEHPITVVVGTPVEIVAEIVCQLEERHRGS
jgi:gluconokinase